MIKKTNKNQNWKKVIPTKKSGFSLVKYCNYIVISGIAISVFIYVVGLYNTASKVALIKSTESQIATIEGAVRKLDSQYLALSGKVTPENAIVYGLKEVKPSMYISRTTFLGRVDDTARNSPSL